MPASKRRFANSHPGVVIGNFPWYEMVWRSLRGEFTPRQPPAGGYDAFARAWSVPVDHARLAQRTQSPVVTWLGHVSILLQVGGINVLMDPTLASHAGPLGRFGAPRRVPAPLKPEALPPIDVVLISHNHYDHLCYGTLRRLHKAGQTPRVVVPQGLGRWFTQRGFGNVTELGWWEHADIASGLRVHFTPSQHWSRRTPWDTNVSLWGGFVLEWAAAAARPWRFLYPGDTGYSDDFKTIRQRLGAVDFVALPIGAYLPRDFMKPMHVNPAEAVQLLRDVGATQAMGVHWGTFMLTQEAFDHPPRDLADALAQHGLPLDTVWLMRHGETRAIGVAPTLEPVG
jgi:L-ascorbate metabolism protein UlaG (beta-lactamase superfamily)